MGMRAGNVTRFLPRLLIFLLFCLTRAVLMAEAIFADGCGHQRFNLVAHRQPGKIILWDEGPGFVLRCKTGDSHNKTFFSFRKTSHGSDRARQLSVYPG